MRIWNLIRILSGWELERRFPGSRSCVYPFRRRGWSYDRISERQMVILTLMKHVGHDLLSFSCRFVPLSDVHRMPQVSPSQGLRTRFMILPWSAAPVPEPDFRCSQVYFFEHGIIANGFCWHLFPVVLHIILHCDNWLLRWLIHHPTRPPDRLVPYCFQCVFKGMHVSFCQESLQDVFIDTMELQGKGVSGSDVRDFSDPGHDCIKYPLLNCNKHSEVLLFVQEFDFEERDHRLCRDAEKEDGEQDDE